MPNPVPLEFEPSAVEDSNKYVIQSPIEIVFILRTIMQKNTAVKLYFDQGTGFVLTSLLGVDAEQGKMVLDYGTHDEINQRALQAAQLVFISSHDQARVQFVCHGVAKTRFEGRNAFSIDIPESLLRMQKREYYRIATPAVNPLKCTIPLPAGHTPDTVEIMVQDISCGGITLIDRQCKVDFKPGTTYGNSRIVLPEIGTLNVSIHVKSAVAVILQNGLAGKRYGCEFIAAKENMLAMIQRYILKLEREKRAK